MPPTSSRMTPAGGAFHDLLIDPIPAEFFYPGSGPFFSSVRLEGTVSSHVDLLPTLLGLAGADEAVLRGELERTHSEVHPLVGEDLSGLMRGDQEEQLARSVYVMTRDNVAAGAEERSLGARRRGARRATGPALMSLPAYVSSNLEALVTRHGSSVFKLVRTFDDPSCWTEPELRHLANRTPLGRRYRSDVILVAWEL